MIVLTFDPGDHNGWCVIDSTQGLIASGELPDWHGIKELFNQYQPDVVVYEVFRLYEWKAKALSWNTFLPVEVIGVIRFLCFELDIPCIGQQPAERKFFTDDRLKEYGMFDKSSKHARDAIRHGLFYLKFGRNKKPGRL